MEKLDERTIKLMCAYFADMIDNLQFTIEENEAPMALDNLRNLMEEWVEKPEHVNTNRKMLLKGFE